MNYLKAGLRVKLGLTNPCSYPLTQIKSNPISNYSSHPNTMQYLPNYYNLYPSIMIPIYSDLISSNPTNA